MNIQIVIAPHERHEALEAYRDWLTSTQIDEIEDAPEGAIVGLQRINGETFVHIEGN